VEKYVTWRCDEVECLHVQQNQVVGICYLEIEDFHTVCRLFSFQSIYPSFTWPLFQIRDAFKIIGRT
jgi:D-arabinose 1-dehydrogenase-like Zn-dependent alcohol dehydrogenase